MGPDPPPPPPADTLEKKLKFLVPLGIVYDPKKVQRILKWHLLSTNHLRNAFDFWKVHGIMNTSGLLQS